VHKLPLLVSVPHAGLAIPPEVAALNRLTAQEIAEDGDVGAREIYGELAPYVAAFVISDIARAFVDLNRAEDDIRKDGVIKTHTCWDVPVYERPLSPPADRGPAGALPPPLSRTSASARYRWSHRWRRLPHHGRGGATGSARSRTTSPQCLHRRWQRRLPARLGRGSWPSVCESASPARSPSTSRSPAGTSSAPTQPSCPGS
jgi:hypothetical protein